MRRYSAHLGYMFTEYPLAERFAAASRAGFDAVEHPGPYEIAADKVAQLCADHRLDFVQMALPIGGPGEKGIACLPGREQEFREGVARGLDYARTISSRFVHVMSGLRPADKSIDEVWPVYIDNLKFACEAGEKAGMPVLIEPIGKATIEGYLIDHPDIALEAMNVVGSANLFMLFDAFHATNAGVDALAFAERHAGHMRHVHIADHPGRHEPGTGDFDFPAFFAALDRAGYDGAIGLEYIPAGDTAAGLNWRQTF